MITTLRLPLVNAQLFQFRGEVGTSASGTDTAVDVKDLAIFADIKRHPGSKPSLKNTVSICHFPHRIAQDRVVELQGFCKFCVGFYVVAARSEISHLKLLNLFAALTERLAFGGSSTGEGLGIPGNYHHLLILVIGKLISFAVTSLH